MSVALLLRLKANVEVSDEAESFFYVVLYHAVRYLQSNFTCNTVANYIDEFFDQYGFDNDQYTCGHKKLSTIKDGLLANFENELVFAAPGMNAVLKKLLLWFRAHYIVTKYDLTPQTTPFGVIVPPASLPSPCPPTAPPRPPTPPSPSGPAFVADSDDEYEDEEDMEAPRLSSVNIPEDEGKAAPTAKERQLAALVDTHDAMLVILKDALEWDAPQWAHGENVGDRVPSKWTPEKKTLFSQAALVTGTASNKKQRLENPVQSDQPFFRKPPPPAWPPKIPTRRSTLSSTNDSS